MQQYHGPVEEPMLPLVIAAVGLCVGLALYARIVILPVLRRLA
jgi:hypothetical protein